MAKRLYQIAKALDVNGLELVHFLREQGFDVKSHMSLATPEMIEAVEKKYQTPKPAPKKVVKKAAPKRAVSKPAEGEAKAPAAKKPAKAPVKQPAAKKPAGDAAKVELKAVEAPPAAEPPEKRLVEVVKKADKEAAAAARAARKLAEEEQEREKEKEREKPRVIRYAPGMEPGARVEAEAEQQQQQHQHQQQPQHLPAGTKDFKIRSQPRRGSGAPGAQRSLSSARAATSTATAEAPAIRGKRKRRKKSPGADEQEIKRSIRQTMASMESKGGARKRRRGSGPGESAVEVEEFSETRLRILPLSTLSELANAMKVMETEVIASCLRNGLMVTINQRLEREDIELIAGEYGFQVEFLSDYEAGMDEEVTPISADELKPRPPVVTVMGHVDHGKTKLLDNIRKANVAEGEAGAITQHIGAYSVELPGGRITFIDTPGHEAFTQMRARGAQVTDIVILIVAADDGVMPQTIEAIDHAKAAQVPIIVAVNKMDLPSANPDRVKQDLLKHGITAEDFGGQTVVVPISAKFGTGIDKLLEMVLLQAEFLDLKGAPDRGAKGTVIDAGKDPGRGVMFTILVQQGTLRVGMPFDVGLHYGTVRALIDEWGERTDTATPGSPVAILGASGVPEAGDVFNEVESEVKAREISNKRQQLRREQEIRFQRRMGLEDLYAQIQKGEVQELKLVLKGDVAGSVEAMADNFQKMSTGEVKVVIIHKSVGTVNESDVLLAAASNAIIIGFNVRPQVSVRELAKREHVEIRTYDIIYEAVADVKQAMSGLLRPEKREKVLGSAEVRQVFRVPKAGAIAGCYVLDGTIERHSLIRILRDGVVLGTRKISSLKRFKEDAGKVESGFECGIGLEDFQDVKEGDILEAFVTEEVARTL